MIARGFKPVAWVAAVAVPALGCYMLSLKVAAERADLAAIEARIQSASQDIRTLQTELGTRGRMQQLEQWNAEVLALSAPVAAQFVGQGVSLARFDTRQPSFDAQAEVRMAAAETPRSASPIAVTPQQASLDSDRPASPRSAAPLAAAPQRATLERTVPAEARTATPTVQRASLTTESRPAATPPARRASAEARPTERRPAASVPAATRRGEQTRRTSLVSADTATALRREARTERGRPGN